MSETLTATTPALATPARTDAPMLQVRGVKTFYGNIMALRGVDVDVYKGEIVTLIGSNGAGKSTLMMTIFGQPRPREGSILFEGRDITQVPTHEIAHLKIAQSPEGRRIFPRMSVFENLQMGAAVDGFAHFDADLEKVFVLFPRLKGEHKGAFAVHIRGLAGDAARQASQQFFAGGDETQVGAAEVEGITQALTLTHGQVGTVFPGRSQYTQGNGIDDGDA